MSSAAELDQRKVVEDHYRLLSVSVCLRAMEEEFVRAIRWHLSPFRVRKTDPDAALIEVHERNALEWADLDFPGPLKDYAPRYTYARDRIPQRNTSLVGALQYALWDIHALVPSRSRDYLFIHAGAVARDGQALLLPGSMDAGKSTLTAALLKAQFEYLSDEFGVIHLRTASAYPFEKHITLDEEALRLLPEVADRLHDRQGLSASLPQRYVRPQDLDVTVAEPGPVRWIVFLNADREGPARLAPLTRAEALRNLIAHSFNLEPNTGRGIRLLSRVVTGADTYLMKGGTPAERAGLLSEAISAL